MQPHCLEHRPEGAVSQGLDDLVLLHILLIIANSASQTWLGTGRGTADVHVDLPELEASLQLRLFLLVLPASSDPCQSHRSLPCRRLRPLAFPPKTSQVWLKQI